MTAQPWVGFIESTETERLRLERWDHDRHGPALDAVNRDCEVMRYLNDGVGLSWQESDELSLGIARHWREHGFGLWAAVERTSGDTLGFVGVCRPLWFAALLPAVEVGWRLRRDAWGSGYATEGARVALRASFETLGLTEVIALVHPDNARSAGVARRLGMRVERRVPHPFRPHPLDVHVVSRHGAAGPSGEELGGRGA